MAPARRIQGSAKGPSASTWIFLLKFRRHTILLHHAPTDSMYELRRKLLEALRSVSTLTPLESPLDPDSLPRNPRDVLLGVPVDNEDLTQGFIDLEISANGISSAVSKSSRAKRKRASEVDSGRVSEIELESEGDLEALEVLRETPQLVGLRDNQVLAFRWRDPNRSQQLEDENEDLTLLSPKERRKRQRERALRRSDFEVEIPETAVEEADEEIEGT